MSAVITAITSVFTAMGTWFTTAVGSMVPIFYDAENGLTFLGTLAVCGLAISITFLLLNVVVNFMTFRG